MTKSERFPHLDYRVVGFVALIAACLVRGLNTLPSRSSDVPSPIERLGTIPTYAGAAFWFAAAIGGAVVVWWGRKSKEAERWYGFGIQTLYIVWGLVYIYGYIAHTSDDDPRDLYSGIVLITSGIIFATIPLLTIRVRAWREKAQTTARALSKTVNELASVTAERDALAANIAARDAK